MDTAHSIKLIHGLHAAFLSLASVALGVSLLLSPPSISIAQNPCLRTDHRPMWILGMVSLLFGVILRVWYMCISSALRPTDEDPHPHMSRRLFRMIIAYGFGVLIFEFMMIACLILAFKLKVARVACLPIAIKVLLLDLPAIYALSYIYFFYPVYRELVACVTAPVPAAASAEPTAMPDTAHATAMPEIAQATAMPGTTQMTTQQMTAASHEMVDHVDSDVSSYWSAPESLVIEIAHDVIDIVEIPGDIDDIVMVDA